MKLDLADLQSVRDFVNQFLNQYQKLDGLVCNAGLVTMGNKVERTKDGFELTIGVSYFGHFLLTDTLYAMELTKRLEDTGITAVSVHPGWACSNFGGKGLITRIMRVVMLPLNPFITESNEEAAQTSLHCLLSDDVPKHSGAYFSQRSVL